MKINKATFALMPADFQAAFTVNPANADEYDNGVENAPALKTALDAEKPPRRKPPKSGTLCLQAGKAN